MILAFAFSCIAVFVFSLLLGILVITKNFRGSLNKIWFITSMAIAFWSLGLFGVVITKDIKMAFYWQYLLDFGGILIPVNFSNFVSILLEENKKNRKWYFVKYGFFYAITVALLALSFFPVFKTGMEPLVGFNYWVKTGPTYLLFPLTFTFFLAYSFVTLLKSYFSSFGIKKEQIKYVLLALLFGFGGGLTDFFPQMFTSLKLYPFGNYFIILYVFFITYSISRHRLMDIKNLIKKSTVFALLVIIIGSIFAFLSSLIVKIIDVFFKIDSSLLSSLLVAIFIAIIFQPLKNTLEDLTDRVFFTKKYVSSEILIKVNKIISSIIDLDTLLSSISKKLEEIFHYNKISVLLIDKNKNGSKLGIYYQEGFDVDVLEKFAKGKTEVLPWYFSQNNETIVIDELKSRYESGEYQPKSVELLYGLYELSVSLVVPLFAKEKLIGIVVIGNKKSGDPYNSEDLKVINIIAGQLGMAIENARLYEEQKNFNVHLKDEVKKATAKLEAANNELQRLDDAKSEFLSIASHQLRTPLTITKGYVSMMQEGSFGKVPKIIMENLNKVYTANERLLNLVENLLDISRIEAGRLEFNLEPVDLVETAKALVQDFQGKAKAKKIKLEFCPDPKLPKCLADAQKIKEVVSNLIDNSIKYTNKGEIIVGIHQESQSIVFACQDTGMGIEPEDLPRLFNKFVRGKGMMTVHTEGTGLGLYFARVVIENMGGRIWAESPGKDRGSKFTFSLPLADKKKAQKIKTIEKIKNPA